MEKKSPQPTFRHGISCQPFPLTTPEPRMQPFPERSIANSWPPNAYCVDDATSQLVQAVLGKSEQPLRKSCLFGASAGSRLARLLQSQHRVITGRQGTPFPGAVCDLPPQYQLLRRRMFEHVAYSILLLSTPPEMLTEESVLDTRGSSSFCVVIECFSFPFTRRV